MMTVEQTILTRCSVREFTKGPVTTAQLEDLVAAGLAAPWAFHDHPRHLCVIQGHENVQRLATVFCKVLGRPGYNMYRPAAAILACTEKGNDNQKLEVGCILQNIFLRAAELGLGSCWINQARDICDHEAVRPMLRQFGVPDTHVVWGIAVIGHPAHPISPTIHREGTYNIYSSIEREGEIHE